MRKLALGALCLGLGFLAACGGDDGVVTTPIDAKAIDAVVQLDCDPLQPAGMQGCETGQKCTWITIVADDPMTMAVDEFVGKLGCTPDGTANLGAACTHGMAGETTGFDSCKAGAVCIDSLCKDVCGFGGGANESCAQNFACTRYSDTFANGTDTPLYGACNPTCNPVTQLRGDGTTCPSGNGCYLLVSDTDSTAVCARAGTGTHGMTIAGGAFANSCVPGAQPRRANPTDMTVECGGLCDPKDVFITNPADAGGTNVRPTVPADPNKVTNFAAEGGAAPYNCATKWGAAAPNDPAAGESCRYWWAREGDFVSQYSNTVGWCFKHSIFQFDSDGNMSGDSPWPRCAALTKSDIVLPVNNPPVNDTLWFFCEAEPTMLQGSIHGVKKLLSYHEVMVDRLAPAL